MDAVLQGWWVGTTLSGRTSIAVSGAYTVPDCNEQRKKQEKENGEKVKGGADFT